MGTVEGISTLVLFGVAMPLKYAAGMPMAVRIAGSIHGFLFVVLVVMFIQAITKVPIPRRLAVLGILAAVVPFGPFVMDGKLVRIAEGK
jgi:integral membrane protein